MSKPRRYQWRESRFCGWTLEEFNQRRSELATELSTLARRLNCAVDGIRYRATYERMGMQMTTALWRMYDLSEALREMDRRVCDVCGCTLGCDASVHISNKHVHGDDAVC